MTENSLEMILGSNKKFNDKTILSVAATEQVTCWENILGLRISLQKIIDIGNKLPIITKINENEDKDMNNIDSFNSSLDNVFGSKKHDDLYFNYTNVQNSLLDLVTSINNLLEMQNANDNNNNNNKRNREISWDDIISTQKSLKVNKWENILNKWHARLHFGSEHKKSNMHVFNQTIFEQIAISTENRDRIIEKSRIPQKESQRIDNFFTEMTKNNQNNSYDEEVYDDRIFYSMLLKTFVMSSSSSSSNTLRSNDLEALRKYRRSKSVVDRKASKGRKIRYIVHKKLQNFMFPIPAPPSNIDSDRLIQSLFQ